MAQQDWMTKDFYRVLGIDKSADAQTIKKAYRKLARQYHPDQNPGDKAAEEKFKEIGEAYGVLSDPKQRKQYDALRAMAGGGARFSAGPGGAAGPGSFEDVFASVFGGGTGRTGGAYGNPRVRFTTNGGGGAGGFDDVLSGLFGAAGGQAAGGANPFGFASQPATPPRGADLRSETELTLRQAVEGATLRLTVEGREMTVRVPAGMHDGQQLRLRGKGRQVPGGEPGDRLLKVHITPHPVFSLRGDSDIEPELPITVGEAVGGASIDVPLPDGTSARIKVPAGTSSGTKLRLRGKGVKAHGKRRAGDLFVKVKIVVPKKPSREAKKAAEAFDAAADLDVRAGLADKARW